MEAQPIEKTQELIETLVAARQETLALLGDTDLSCVAHPDSGWTVQDIVNHLAWCDRWAVKVLEKTLSDIAVDIPKWWMQDDANDVVREQCKHFSVERSFADLSAAHEAFKSIIEDTPPEKLLHEFKASWGPMITAVTLVNIMVEHEEEHREEIRLAVIS